MLNANGSLHLTVTLTLVLTLIGRFDDMLNVDGSLHVKEDIWVGTQRIVAATRMVDKDGKPHSNLVWHPSVAAKHELDSLRAEVAELRATLSRFMDRR